MEYRLLRSFPNVDPSPVEWNALLKESVTDVPFLRWEYLRAWWETRGGGEWSQAQLLLVTAYQQGQLAGIAPLFAAENRDGLPALLLLGSIEISDYLDLLARPAHLPDFIPGLLDFLSTSQDLPAWKVLDLYNLPEASPSVALLNAAAVTRGWAFTQERAYHAPFIPLPGDFETYLASIDKKQRHEIRRKIRRAEETGGVRWYIVDDPAALDAEVDAFMALMANEPEKAAFLTEPMRWQMHLSCRAAFENGWLQLAFMEVDGRKAAGYLNLDYLNRIWVYNSGIDRAFMELSPGWVLLGHLLQWANEHGRSEFDFMRGNEDYKYRFGAVDRFVIRCRLTR